VHVDRNTAYETGLVRRLAFILYLNKSWKPEYGGQLELWNADGTRSEAAIEPQFNRTVIFEIDEDNYHGVPNPIAAPSARSRNSFLVYFHTAASGQGVSAHSSIYARPGSQPKQPALRRLIKDVVPPILFRNLQKLRAT
jgi:2OG-Fe(II) oxygenase superfamily